MLGDFVVHFLPVYAMVMYHKREKKFVPPQAAAMGFLGQLFFAYSQAGKLDMSQIYVPHDVSFAWLAALLGHMFAPMLSNNFLKGNYGRSMLSVLFMFTPYLLKKLGIRGLRNRKTIAEKRRARRMVGAARRGKEAVGSGGSDSEGTDFDGRCLMCQKKRRRMMKASGRSGMVIPLRRQIIEKLTGLRSHGMRRSISSNFLQSQKISIV